jgi:hypothetical protein
MIMHYVHIGFISVRKAFVKEKMLVFGEGVDKRVTALIPAPAFAGVGSSGDP